MPDDKTALTIDRTLIDELVDDEARWQRYLASGQSVPLNRVRDKLIGLAREAGGKAERE